MKNKLLRVKMRHYMELMRYIETDTVLKDFVTLDNTGKVLDAFILQVNNVLDGRTISGGGHQ